MNKQINNIESIEQKGTLNTRECPFIFGCNSHKTKELYSKICSGEYSLCPRYMVSKDLRKTN